ncbi:hypothetical protein RHECIAT_CH0003307 [Rhizobium etli CIAT 652]|uniref:Uncharacterized protein n=1 Tax=Rhizobium etli (strain CIAT 652) TaxID=491916 RepID=B3PVN5_RHIE6|nr:hypothetical protein RHECIAT_CH0003307 [Rhizobium etli CIAT 652]
MPAVNRNETGWQRSTLIETLVAERRCQFYRDDLPGLAPETKGNSKRSRQRIKQMLAPLRGARKPGLHLVFRLRRHNNKRPRNLLINDLYLISTDGLDCFEQTAEFSDQSASTVIKLATDP